MIEPLRHLDVFSPDAFGNRKVDIIGAGATGSRIALSVAKLGVQNICVHDFDTVEEHNVPNQVFGNNHVGMKKVDALAEIVKAATGTVIKTNDRRVNGSEFFGDVVFLLTDTMDSRREIWQKGIKFKLRVRQLIETRMGSDNGRVYSLSPSRINHIKAWEETLYDDGAAEVSACGASVSVGPTAEIISGLAVWQMVRWFAHDNSPVKNEEPENEIIFGLRPITFLSRKF